MSRYLLLFILNVPFVCYGYLKAIVYFKEAQYNRTQLVARLLFWSVALCLIVFADPLYNFLINKRLTNSVPLSLADVLLATLCSFLLAMVIRLYTRVEKAERKTSELVEALALKEKRD